MDEFKEIEEEEHLNKRINFFENKKIPLFLHGIIAFIIGVITIISVGDGDATGLAIMIFWFYLMVIPIIPAILSVILDKKKMSVGRIFGLYYLYLIFFQIGMIVGYNLFFYWWHKHY